MSPTTQGLIVLVVTLVMLLSGAPVAFGLGVISIVFIVIFQGFSALHVVAETFYAGLNDFTLVSIPMFVMMGAIPVYLAAWLWRRGRSSPFGAELPAKADHRLDGRLFLGAGLFGVGWGITGVCPGPAVTNLAAPSAFTLAALGAMSAGVLLSLLLPKRVR